MTAVLDKPALRARMRIERRRLAGLAPQAAQRAAEYAGDLPAADIVAFYRATGSELDPQPLARALSGLGRRLCLPVVVGRDVALVFRRWTPDDPLEPDLAGLPAPTAAADAVAPDLIVAPLLAFDARGARLGQGGGHYDRTFAALPSAIRIGLAYAGQQIADLPLEPHDVPLHGVLTELGYRTSR